MFRAEWDDTLQAWTVKDDRGFIHAQGLADRHTAEDIAHAMTCAYGLDPHLVRVTLH